MAWIELTAARLAAKTAELPTIKGLMVPSGQTAESIIAEELASTVKRVRGYCPESTRLGDGQTIPDELEDSALALVREKVFTRIDALKGLFSLQRQKEAEEAIKELVRWSEKKLRVVPPEAPAEEQASSGSAATLVGVKRPTTARRQTDGLV